MLFRRSWRFFTRRLAGRWPPSPLSSASNVAVDLPQGRRLEYDLPTYDPSNCNWVDSWQKLGRMVLRSGGTILADTQRQYVLVPITSGCSTMVPSQTTLVQEGRTFTTTFHYSPSDFGDYHRPDLVTEQGELTRQTSRTYRHDFGSRYIRGRVASETVTVNGESFSSSFGYDNEGFLTWASRLGITTTSSRDGAGNRASVTDANGRTAWFTYQNGVQQNTFAPLTSETRGINHIGTVAWASRAGLTTEFNYDAAGRLVQTSYPGQGRTGISTTFDNWGGAQVTTCRASACTTTTVDGFGRPRTTIDPSGVSTTVSYDVFGRKVSQTRPGSGLADTFEYDGLDRVTRVAHPDGTDVLYGYNGQTLTVIDETDRPTVQQMPAFGSPADARLTLVIDALNQHWHYSYNALGSLTRVSAPLGPDRVWNYNSRNELVSDAQPESGVTVYEYDASGNLTYKRDARNQEFRYTYDANSRVTFIDVGNWDHNTTITYDLLDRRREVTRGQTAIEFFYDNGGRLQKRRETIDLWHGFDIFYTHDAEDRLTRIDYPSGRQVYYTYNPAGRVTKVEAYASGWTTVADNFQYHASGALTGFTRGNGTSETMTIDPSTYRVTQLVSGPVNLSYAYDQVGNVTAITDPRSGFSSTFAYDALDRLIDVTGFGARAFTYDALGNRLTKSYAPANAVTYSYSGGTMRLDSAAGAQETATFTYDAVGNLLTELTPNTLATYTYTPFNQMATAAIGPSTGAYLYNGDNQRKRRQTTAGVTYTLHGAGGEILSEYDKPPSSGPVWQRDFVYLGSKVLMSVGNSTATPPTVVTAYYHTDLLGSVRAVTDAAGNLTTAARRDYYAFGEEHAQPQHPQAPLSGERQRFAGKQEDPETFLQYFEARYYDSGLGRFTSVDPVIPAFARVRPQAWNRYAYALNGPVRFGDPSGLEAEEGGEPALESSNSLSGFTLDGFNAWADEYVFLNESLGPKQRERQDEEAACSDEQQSSAPATSPSPSHPFDTALRGVGSFFAGAGDCLTGRCLFLPGSLTEIARFHWQQGDSAVGKSGMAYFGGQVFGGAVGSGLVGGGSATFAAVKGGKYGAYFGRPNPAIPGSTHGLLNRGVVRFGWGWKGPGRTGVDVIRIGIGSKRGTSWWSHIEMWIVR